MALMTFELIIHYEDGRTEEVRADQRDCAVFERAEKVGTTKALDTMPMVFMRSIAYNALTRTGRLERSVTRGNWEESVIEVEVKDEDSPNAGTQETLDTD